MNNSLNFDETRQLFGFVDYTAFGLTLLVSLGVGVYFGVFKKAANAKEYLYGGKEMTSFPVAISLLASQISAGAMIALPSDVYAYGAYFALTVPMMIPTAIIISFLFLPLLYKLNISSAYEYLEMRFGYSLKMLISYTFIINLLAFLPIIIYLPAMTLSEVSGFNTHLINAVVCAVCVAYTVLGGMKAVIWSDVFLAAIMVLSCFVVVILGVIEVGGITEVWNKASEGGRFDFDYSASLTKRNTFWNACLNAFLLFSSYAGLNQTSVQKLVSVKTLPKAKWAVFIFAIGFALIVSLCAASGIVMYATYHGCDPVKAGIIDNSDKLVANFVLKTVGHISGLSGLFISAVFSASLSTMSASLNAMAGIIYTDVIQPCKWYTHTELKSGLIIKIIILIIGIYSVLMGFVIEQFQNIMSLIMLCLGISQGVTFGVFTLGMLTPWANLKGTYAGSLVSFLFCLWIGIGGQVSILQGNLSYPTLPTSTDLCMNETVTSIAANVVTNVVQNTTSEPFVLYKLSPLYFSVLSILLVWVVAVPVSFCTDGGHITEENYKLLSPLIHRWLPKKQQSVESIQMTKKLDIKNSNPLIYEAVNQSDNQLEVITDKN